MAPTQPVVSAEEGTSAAAAQVMVTLCPDCRRGSADAGGEALPLTSSELDRLCCDAQVLPTTQTDMVVGGRSHVGPGAAPAEPSASHVGLSAVLDEVERRAGLMVATEMPETLRRSFLRRHKKRCGVQGCSNGAHLHVHHCDLTSEGGNHDPDRALPDPAKNDAARIAFSALCNSGYKQSEARAAVDAIRDRITPEMPVAEVVRLAFVASAGLPSQHHVFQAREALAPYMRLEAAA